MRIGIIGAGRIGGALARVWARAGHEVMLGLRDPTRVTEAFSAVAIGPVAAAVDSETVVFAAPFGAWFEIARDHGARLVDRIVVDAANPLLARDGSMAADALDQGAGVWTAALLPGARVVKAFNTMGWDDLRDAPGRPSPRLAMPIVSDDAAAITLVEGLVRDAGLDPVVVGGLDRSRELDPGGAAYATSLTAGDLRRALGLRADGATA